MKLFLVVCSTIVFLLVSINFFVSLVIFLGEDHHVIDQIKIYQVFEEPIYRRLRGEIMKQNYTILIGGFDSGVKNFIEHQANLQTLEGKAVVIKHYQSPYKSKQRLMSKIKETRFYLEFALGIDRQQRTEVFFVNQEYEIPYEEIKFIKSRYPNDNIILVCHKDLGIKIKGFQTIHFPPVKEKSLKKILSVFYHMDNALANELLDKYGHSVGSILNHFKKQAKDEDMTAQDLIEVEEIEDMNQMSHQIAEHQQQKILQKHSKKRKQKKEIKTSTERPNKKGRIEKKGKRRGK